MASILKEDLSLFIYERRRELMKGLLSSNNIKIIKLIPYNKTFDQYFFAKEDDLKIVETLLENIRILEGEE